MQIAALTVGPEYNANFGNLYTFFMQQLVQVCMADCFLGHQREC